MAEKARKAVANFGSCRPGKRPSATTPFWTQFSAGRPGVVPAGTNQSTKDLRVYENVVAIAESGGKHVQVLVGTLVQVGDAWRVIDLPQPMVEGQAAASPSGLFFAAVLPLHNDAGGNAPSEALQKLLADLESLDREVPAAATPADQAKFAARRAELLEQIAGAAKTADERGRLAAATGRHAQRRAQAGTCPDGIDRLKALLEKLESRDTDKNLIAYIKFRQFTTSYVLSMQAAQTDTAKIQAIQAKWLKTLENFATDYPGAPTRPRPCCNWPSARSSAGRRTRRRSGTGGSSRSSPMRPRAGKRPAPRSGSTASAEVIEVHGQTSTAAARSTFPSIAARSCSSSIGPPPRRRPRPTWPR